MATVISKSLLRTLARSAANQPSQRDDSQTSQRPQSDTDVPYVVQSSGPSGQADYTDERYWIARVQLATTSDDPTARIRTAAVTDSRARIITATNIGELPSGVGSIAAGPHALGVGTIVFPRPINAPGNKRTSWVINVDCRVLVLRITAVSGTTYPRSYTAVSVWQGSESTAARPCQNFAEADYNPLINDSYKPFAVGEIVSGWWDYTNQRYAFRSLRIYTVDLCT